MRRRIALGVGAVLLAGWLAYLLIPGGRELALGTTSAVGVVGEGTVDGPRRTVERFVPSERDPEPVAPLDEAFEGLVEVTGGFAIACPAPPELDEQHLPIAGRVVRPVLEGRTFRAVVRSPEGEAPVERWLPRKCAPDGPDAGPGCEENPRYEGPLFAVAWSGGADGVASCRFQPLTEVRVAGRVERRDGGPVNPDTVGVSGCNIGDLAEDGSFEGSMTLHVGCLLFGTGPHALGSVLTVNGDGPRTDLVFVVAPPTAYGATPAGLKAMDRGEAHLAEKVVAETPEVELLRDPELSPEARALVHGWVEADAAEAAELLRITSSLNDLARRAPRSIAPPPPE